MGALGGLVRFVVGGAAGAAVGVAVASLLAPQRGEEFQQDVHQRLAESKAAGELAEQTKVAELKERYRRKVGDPDAFTGTHRAGSAI